jgi:hypothetical protein
MQFRWILVLVVVLWVLYEFASPSLQHLWTTHHLHIKFGLGIAGVLMLLCLPSLESLLNTNTQLTEHIRGILFYHAPHASVQSRIANGVHMARGGTEDIAPPTLPQSTPHTAPHTPAPHTPAPHTAPHTALRLTDTLRTKIAAAQHWKCERCRQPLCSNFIIHATGAVCSPCGQRPML